MRHGWMPYRTSLFFIAACAFEGIAYAQNDTLIVPNERVGKVRLAMTPAQLLALREPSRSSWYESDGGGQIYEYVGDGRTLFSVTIPKADGTVTAIAVSTAAYMTAEGNRVGNSNLAVRAKLGNPQREVPLQDPNWVALCYPSKGLFVWTNRGVVTSTMVYRIGRRGWSGSGPC